LRSQTKISDPAAPPVASNGRDTSGSTSIAVTACVCFFTELTSALLGVVVGSPSSRPDAFQTRTVPSASPVTMHPAFAAAVAGVVPIDVTLHAAFKVSEASERTWYVR
jgi:hypothetical protein